MKYRGSWKTGLPDHCHNPLRMNDYLQLIVEVSVTVYVFLLGLPILVFQIFLPDDLRRVSKNNYTGNFWLNVVVLTLLLMFIVAIASPEDPVSNLLRFELTNFTKDVIITVLFFAMVGFTLRMLFGHLVKSQGYRAKVVNVIQRKILQQHERQGVVNHAYLEDLDYLGIYSKPGAETQVVINALESILQGLNSQGTTQSDDSALLAVIETLCNSVANSAETGSRQNMVEVLTIYKNLLMDLKRRSTEERPLIYGNESRKIKDCTTRIALMALKHDYVDMMPLVLNVLTLIPGAADKLFEIGQLALERRQYKIATNVLAELMDRDNLDERKMHYYLGLIVHFLDAGEAAREYALRSLERNRVHPTEETIEAAARHHFGLSNFSTVDRLREFVPLLAGG